MRALSKNRTNVNISMDRAAMLPRPDDHELAMRMAKALRAQYRNPPSWVDALLGPAPGWKHAFTRRVY